MTITLLRGRGSDSDYYRDGRSRLVSHESVAAAVTVGQFAKLKAWANLLS